MKFLAWGFKCKTSGCNHVHIAKFIGRNEGQKIMALPSVMPGWFDFQCGYCGEAHRYFRQDMELIPLDDTPPAGFQPWF